MRTVDHDGSLPHAEAAVLQRWNRSAPLKLLPTRCRLLSDRPAPPEGENPPAAY